MTRKRSKKNPRMLLPFLLILALLYQAASLGESTTVLVSDYTSFYGEVVSVSNNVIIYPYGVKQMTVQSGAQGDTPATAIVMADLNPDDYTQNPHTALVDGNYVYRVQVEVSPGGYDFVDNSLSDVDSAPDKGTHTIFANQQAGPDSIHDTLTEGNTRVVASSSGKGVAFWGASTTTQPQTKFWDGSAWGPTSSETDINANIAWVRIKASPTNSSEVLVATMDYTPDVNTFVYNNDTSTWTFMTEVATGLSVIKAGKPTQDFDIAYETSSGDALIVYQDGTTTPKYRTKSASSSSWTAESSLTVSSTGTPHWIILESNPTPSSNEIILLYGDSNYDLYSQVWNGTAWGNEKAIDLNALIADFAKPDAIGRTFDVAYEYNSGYAMVSWYDRTGPDGYYLFWSGSAWDSSGIALTGEPVLTTGKGGWVELVGSDRSSSDSITILVMDSNARAMDGDVWNGASWVGGGTWKSISTDMDGGKNGPHADGRWQSVSGNFTVVWTERIAQGAYYMNYLPGTGWDSSRTQLSGGPAAAMKTGVAMTNDPSSNKLLVLVGEGKTQNDIYAWYFDGLSWGSATTFNSDPSDAAKQRAYYPVYLDGTNGGSDNYELDLEVQWTSAVFNETKEELAIYVGSTGAENIKVDVWYASTWNTVINPLVSGWNNVSVTAYLDSPNFTIRFKGTTETSDISQDSWQIDATILVTGDPPPSRTPPDSIYRVDLKLSESLVGSLYVKSSSSPIDSDHATVWFDIGDTPPETETAYQVEVWPEP